MAVGEADGWEAEEGRSELVESLLLIQQRTVLFFFSFGGVGVQSFSLSPWS